MQSFSITVMALLLAHLLGDFPLQPRWIVARKGKNLPALLWHGAIHYLLALICLQIFSQVPALSIRVQAILIVYLFAHLIIDKIRSRLVALKPSRDNAGFFLIDQSLHLATLTIAASFLARVSISDFMGSIRISETTKAQVLATAIVYIFVVFGGGYLIRLITKGMARESERRTAEQLGNAGMYIGWIERFLVVTAMVLQSPALVGLILTGKSIARYPEFKEARFAEYFLIGTLLSISLAVLGGIVLLQVLYGTVSLKSS
jgi:hypothetical protein